MKVCNVIEVSCRVRCFACGEYCDLLPPDGPGGWQPPAEASTNSGMIIGATIVSLLLVGLLFVVIMVAVWKYRVEPSCARTGQVFILIPIPIVYRVC